MTANHPPVALAMMEGSEGPRPRVECAKGAEQKYRDPLFILHSPRP